MTVVHLDDSVAAALTAQANLQGLSLEGFLAHLAHSDASDPDASITADELEQQFVQLSLDVPPLPADFSRADIYLDHA